MAEINPEYERGFKDGLKSKIGEELQPMIAQVLEGISEAIKGLIPRMIDIMEITANLDAYDWIPCSERLPERGEEVLVWFEYFRYGEYNRLYQTYGIGQYFGKYDDRESWLIDHETGWRDLKVYAWVPMPDAYEPLEEGAEK